MFSSFVDAGINLGLLDRDRVIIPLEGKDQRLKSIEGKADWLKSGGKLEECVSISAGTKVATPVEAVKKLEDLTLGQLRFVHDKLILDEWNQSPFHIESNDRMGFCAGGIMWGCNRRDTPIITGMIS